MDTSKANYEAGKTVGTTQEKGSNLMDKAGKAAESAKNSVLEAGKAVQDKTKEVAPKK